MTKSLRYTVTRCTIVDSAGRPLRRQTTWAVIFVNGHEVAEVADFDTRAQARSYARRLNDEEAGDAEQEAAADAYDAVANRED